MMEEELSYKELGLVDLIYGTLFRPAETFRKVGRNPPIFKSLLIFSLVIIGNLLVSITITPHTLAKAGVPGPFQEVLQGVVPFLAVIGAVVSYLSWVVLAGVLHLVSELFDGKGSALGTLSVLGLIELPRLVAIPFQIAGNIVAQPFISTFLSVLGGAVYFVWWIVLLVIGVKEAHDIPTGKALAVIAVPIFFAALAGIILLIVIIGAFVPMITILSRS